MRAKLSEIVAVLVDQLLATLSAVNNDTGEPLANSVAAMLEGKTYRKTATDEYGQLPYSKFMHQSRYIFGRHPGATIDNINYLPATHLAYKELMVRDCFC